MPSALPESWIDRLFARLEGLYGAKFLDMWRESDLRNVKATWAEKLAGFADKPEALKAAIDACDEKHWPPTLPEFLVLCRGAASRNNSLAALPAPVIAPDEIEKRVAEISKAVKKPKDNDYLAWAKILKNRYLSGECLIICQIKLASQALGEVWANHQCVRVPRKSL